MSDTNNNPNDDADSEDKEKNPIRDNNDNVDNNLNVDSNLLKINNDAENASKPNENTSTLMKKMPSYTLEEIQPFVAKSDFTIQSSSASTKENNYRFNGLSKEELLKYANDPLWKRIRWSCFFLFWLVWFAMLMTAVLVVFFSSKCNRTNLWWRVGPLTELLTNDTDVYRFLQTTDPKKFRGAIVKNPELIDDLRKVQLNAILDIDLVQLIGTSSPIVEQHSDDTIIAEISSILEQRLSNWLRLGFQGFRVNNVPETAVKVNGNRVVFFSRQAKTDLIVNFKNILKQFTSSNGVLIGGEGVTSDFDLFDLVQITVSSRDLISVEHLVRKLNDIRSENQILKVAESVKKQLFPDLAQYFLPATSLISFKYNLSEKSIQTRRHFNRDFVNITTSDYFAYVRYSADKPSILVVLNLSFKMKSINLRTIANFDEKSKFKLLYLPKGILPLTYM